MSEQENESQASAERSGLGQVDDQQLPEDLQPAEDNPLARHPVETGNEADRIGQDREGEPETAPLTEEDAEYGG